MPKKTATVLALGFVFGLPAPAALLGQVPAAQPPVIDTVIIIAQNVFTPQEANNFAFRAMNAIHVITRPQVIWDELLFRAGEPYDSVKLAESERILRTRELFKSVRIDTLTVDGKLAAVVSTQDGWSLRPKFSFTVATDGTWTGQFGLSEINFLGSGNLAHAAWVKEVERQGPELAADFRRLFGSELGTAGQVNFWDDGTDGFWRFGDPWVSNLDPRSIIYDGEGSDRRVLRYRIDDPASPDTSFFRREAFINRITAGLAPITHTDGYLRAGIVGEVRLEKYVPVQDPPLMVDDTVYGEFGVYGELSRSRFEQVSYFNGFGAEDIETGTRLRLTLNVASSRLGYRRSGVGPRLDAKTGLRTRNAFVVSTLQANGLFTEAELDSGRVVVDLMLGYKPFERHSAALYVTAGAQENPPPGQEFNLGFETPPRSWEPNSFVGTRMLWGTLEYRWFAFEAIGNLASVGLAAFVDYGGAWYPDQDSRLGGNIGIGLRIGSALSTAARTGRIDFGCRVGEGSDVGQRCVMTVGAGFVFPWNPEAVELVEKEHRWVR